MSAPTPPTPPAPQKKKGLSPLAIVLIVLGCLVLVVGLVIAAAGWFVYNKVKDVAGSEEIWKENPAFAAAKLALSMNPDVEVVGYNEATGKIKVKNNKTGDEVELDLGQIKSGNFGWSTSGGESGSLSASASGELAGTTQGAGGASTFQFGGGEVDAPPDGVPGCDGCSYKGLMSGTSPAGERSGSITFNSSESPADVAKGYVDGLNAEGFGDVNTMNIGGAQIVTGQRNGSTVTMNAMPGPNGQGSTGNITYSLK